MIELGSGLAACVDPPRDVTPLHDVAGRFGLDVVASFETHLHADFVGGSRELADGDGAEIHAPSDGSLLFPHVGVADGDVVAFGDAEIVVLRTPGHTPEHVSYLVRTEGAPRAVFTGGSLIGGGAARTDLIAPDRTEELARDQFRSFRRLATLPDHVAVYPTHGAGSFCSAGRDSIDAGTIGDQRRSNPLFAIEDEDRFVRRLLAGYGSYPPYFLHLREVNRAGPRLLRTLRTPCPLGPHEVDDAMRRGAHLIDARRTHAWAAEHPVGAISDELRPAFASWLGWVVPFGVPIVLLVDPSGLGEATRQARAIGYDDVLGFVDGGTDAWRRAGLPTASTPQVDVHRAAEMHGDGVSLLDVRQRSELADARIPGAVHAELGDVIAGFVPEKGEAVVFCGHGERSATACSVLERRGVRTWHMTGGISEWELERLPIER